MSPELLSIVGWLKGPIFAAIATSAFSLLFGLHSIDILLASGGAAVGWAIFLAVPHAGSPAFAVFIAALAAGIYGEIIGWARLRPATAYAIAAILPLVPGGGMYYTMLSTLEGNSTKTVELVMTTLMTAFAIAAGLAIANAVGRMIYLAYTHWLMKGNKKL
ncbi:MAG TPA: threonine/serine exporter family protein [Rectinemataceae bacterium]|nr:threonine/serine exporter family protein [Rectinemataceae bacterium]